MIPKYINDWLTIIQKMANDNTYKLAWGRAILECVDLGHFKLDENNAVISYEDIGFCMLKYYWNQMFFFNLKQSPGRVPIVCQDTQKLIDEYKKIKKTSIPCWFGIGQKVLEEKNNELYIKTIKHIAKTLTENVSWRFRYVEGNPLDIYELNQKDLQVIIKKENITDLKDYAIVLSQLLNYRWAQLLEQFNTAPKISSKVKGISESKIRRKSLQQYKEELIKQFEDGKVKDFYSGKELEDDKISIDHVIPWSFMYSDDIWNLVITSKSHNSAKSNTIPSQEDIERLKLRNVDLENKVSDKYIPILQEARKNNYIDTFYFDCRCDGWRCPPVNSTIDYYNNNAKEYADSTMNVDFSAMRNPFLKYLKKGSSILDVGCGSGRDSKAFIDLGYKVEAIDGSIELCKIASNFIGQEVRCLDFESIDYKDEFDGIWACASLLHLDKEKLKKVLKLLICACKSGGYVYCSFKYGDFEIEKDGRYFLYLNEESLKDVIKDLPVEIVEETITYDVRVGRESEKWLNVIFRIKE